jgi:hypothetical protein
MGERVPRDQEHVVEGQRDILADAGDAVSHRLGHF